MNRQNEITVQEVDVLSVRKCSTSVEDGAACTVNIWIASSSV